MTPGRAPRHLSPAAKALYTAVTSDYKLEAHHIALLTKALEAFDRADQARAEIGAGPLTTTTQAGVIRVHPLLAVEREARAQFGVLTKQLGLDIEGPATPSARNRR